MIYSIEGFCFQVRCFSGRSLQVSETFCFSWMTLVLCPFIHSALGSCSPPSGNSCIWRCMCFSVDRNCPEPLPSVRMTVLSWSQGHPASGMVFKNLVNKADSSSFPQRLVPQPIITLGCPLIGAQCTEWRELGERILHAHPTEPFLLNKVLEDTKDPGPLDHRSQEHSVSHL